MRAHTHTHFCVCIFSRLPTPTFIVCTRSNSERVGCDEGGNGKKATTKIRNKLTQTERYGQKKSEIHTTIN